MAVKMNGLSIELLSHPGETLQEVLESNHMTQKELAARIGVSPRHINHIISGLADISAETAFKLEKVFALSASFWNNLQAKYDEEKMQVLEETEITEEEKQVFQPKLYKSMVDYGYLTKETKKERKVIQLRQFFGVSDLRNVPNAIAANALFRRSTACNTDNYAMAAWMKICEIETNGIELASELNTELLRGKLVEIRKLNVVRNPNYILEQLTNIFAECGIAFAIVRNIPGAPVQGFIRKINNKMRLCVTLRNKYSDIFWFTLFHEIGHLLDSKNELFVDFSNNNSNAELAADSFAVEQLISKTAYFRFVQNQDFSKTSIIRFADSQGVLPGIVVGRLQHDRYLSNAYYNDLRLQYVWA